EHLFHVSHEASRPAEADIGFPWDADLVENGSRQVTRAVEVLTHLVERARPAVTHIAAPLRKREHQAADLGGERMMLPIASLIEPQDLSRRPGFCQRIEHCQNRRRSDSSAEQHYRAFFDTQREASAWQADVEHVAHPQLSDAGSCDAIRLDLYADSIALGRWRTRKRVAAKEWRATSTRSKAQDDVLAWQPCSQRLTLRVLHRQRDDVLALPIHRCDRDRPKSRRDRMCRCGWHQPGVTITRRCPMALHQRLK